MKITQNHENFREIRGEVTKKFNEDFNFVQLGNLQKCIENYYEGIIQKEITDDNIEVEKDDDGNIENYDEVEQEIQDILFEKSNDIMWNTLFEAGDSFIAGKLVENVNELHDIGLTVIDVSDMDDEGLYNTGVFLAVNGCGYDFYEAHWIPLYIEILKWVKVEDFN